MSLLKKLLISPSSISGVTVEEEIPSAGACFNTVGEIWLQEYGAYFNRV